MIRNTMLVLAAVLVPAAASADHMTGHTQFTVRIENVSTATSLHLSNGQTAPIPNSPGVWLVHTGTQPVFTPGKAAGSHGLEAQAEDGSPGDLMNWVRTQKSVRSAGAFTTPVGDDKAGPATPGKAYEFTLDAAPGDKLTITTMFGQSNDWFFAPKDGIALFAKGRPISGDLTSKFVLWNAGTEVDEEPGLGATQGPRQSGPNTGPDEHGVVSPAKGYTVPAVAQILKVTISPAGMAAH